MHPKEKTIVAPKGGRHPRSEFEKFIPELTEICSPFDKWEAVGLGDERNQPSKTLT